MKPTIDSDGIYVWPYCPSVPMLEAIEWLNDTYTTHYGDEIVSRYRNRPRVTYELQSVLTHPDYVLAANILHDGAAYPWALPIWPERSVVPSITSGASSISVDTDTASYEDLAIVWQSPRQWEVVQIDNVGNGAITLSVAIEHDYTDARVMPLRIGRILQIPRSETNRQRAIVNIIWQGLGARINPPAPAQYLGDDLDLSCPLVDSIGVKDNYVSRIDVMDELTGLIDTKSPWVKNKRSRDYKSFGNGRLESWALRAWLHRRAGVLRPVWMPTFTQDVCVITTGALGTQFLIHDDGFDSRDHVAVRSKSGDWLIRAVANVARIDTGVLQLTLTESLGINSDDIDLFSYLIRYRLAADRIEIEHLGKEQTRMIVPIMEAP